jgi:hypothetical protein
MSIQKCHKYISKLSNTNIDDEKFGLYLLKLNYWHKQFGGGNTAKYCNKECRLYAKDSELGRCEGTSANCNFHAICSHRSEKKCNITTNNKTCTWNVKTNTCEDAKKTTEYKNYIR